MNERIKQLMRQSGTDSSGKWMGVEHAEKFAESIVRECAGVSLKNSHRDDDMGSIIAKQIKLHFGVEE